MECIGYDASIKRLILNGDQSGCVTQTPSRTISMDYIASVRVRLEKVSKYDEKSSEFNFYQRIWF